MGKAIIIGSNEFREIMNDFTHPLEVIREAIQNSFDANAAVIRITVGLTETVAGQSLDITIDDDGDGISPKEYANFFNLGDSTKRNNAVTIGEKGHGTKIFYNSNKIILQSWVQGKKYESVLNEPYKRIFEGTDLEYLDPVEVANEENKTKGARISIFGYLKNTSTKPADAFAHPAIKDYIQWFTAIATVERQFDGHNHRNLKVFLKSFDSTERTLQDQFRLKVGEDGYEEIPYGYPFPSQEYSALAELKRLAKDQKPEVREWEKLYCKRLYREELHLEGGAGSVQIVVWAIGDKYKRIINPLIRERSHTARIRDFEYKVGDRYGFWACKNYIPIQRIDDWVTGKGNYTKFLAFVNFDGFSLTANRSSIENTKPEYLVDLKKKINTIYDEEVTKNKSYKEWSELEERADDERSAVDEKKEFSSRLKQCKHRKKLLLGGVACFEPDSEGEVALLFSALMREYPDDLKFEILDYNTHKGIDFLMRENPLVPIENDSTVGYLELKYNLEKGRFNHSFDHLRYVVCYNTRGLKVGDEISDLNKKTVQVVKNDRGWWLMDDKIQVGHHIPILVLREFLESKGRSFQ